MKRFSAIIMTMTLTLMLSSVAQANFLGMDTANNEYKWTLEMHQQITDAASNSKFNALQGDFAQSGYNNFNEYLADYSTNTEALYLWGYFSISKVQDITIDPDQDTWVAGGYNSNDSSATGLFWGLKIDSYDSTAQLTKFSGGNAALYTGDYTGSGLTAPNVTSYMTGGEMDYAALAAAATTPNRAVAFN